MQISELLQAAQFWGVNIYPQNGQIQINMQWSINSLPDPVRQVLGELKKRRGELLSHFALVNEQPDIPLLLEALRAQGVHVGIKQGNLKIYIDTKAPNQYYMTCIVLLTELKEQQENAIAYLANADPPPPG